MSTKNIYFDDKKKKTLNFTKKRKVFQTKKL